MALFAWFSLAVTLLASPTHYQFWAHGFSLAHRRDVFRAAFVAASVATPARAADLYQRNPLTNPVLEQLRIWDQNQADTIKYSGELEDGNQTQNAAYPRLLLPILEIAEELELVRSLVKDRINYPDAMKIIQQPKYDKVEFKRRFNAFADNIYYSDPDRANVYLGGGATPKNEQSLAYLLRNDILTNIEDLRAELKYVLSSKSVVVDNEVQLLATNASRSMQEYLKIVPPSELQQAKKLLSETQ